MEGQEGDSDEQVLNGRTGGERSRSEGSLQHNPMLNGLIIQRVFGFCEKYPSQDWASFRSVCRCWNGEAVEWWRASACLTVLKDKITSSGDKLSEEWGDGDSMKDQKEEQLTILELCKLYEDDKYRLRSEPFKKYKFKYWDLDKPMNISSNQSFWNGIGPNVEVLTVEHCQSSQFGASGFLEQVICRKLRNLRELTLCHNNFRLPVENNEDEQRDWSIVQAKLGNVKQIENVVKLSLDGRLPFELRMFYKVFPKLEDVRIGSCSKLDKFDYATLYENGWWLFPDEVKHMDMMLMRWCQKEGSSLREIRFMATFNQRLESFGLKVQSNEHLCGDYKMLLNTERDTLKSLKIYKKPFSRPGISFPFDIKFSSMENLQLWGHVAGNFGFLKAMPRLKQVYINRNCFEIREDMTEDFINAKKISLSSIDMVRDTERFDMSQVRMEHLSFLHVDFLFPEDSLRKLAIWIPNLRFFHTIANNEGFRVICEKWGGSLEELELLYGNKVGDEGICSRTFQNLSNLRKFSIEANCAKGRLTDISVYHGFLKLPLLHTLKICVSPEMSLSAEELLYAKIFSVKVIRNYEKDHQGECCLRKKYEDNYFAPSDDDDQL